MLLQLILVDIVGPTLCVAACAIIMRRDRRHREDSVQAADDHQHATWGDLCAVRELVAEVRQLADQLVTDESDPFAATQLIRQVMPRTDGQADRSSGGAGRHHRGSTP